MKSNGRIPSHCNRAMSWRSSGHGDEVVSEHRTTGWDDGTANEVVRDRAGIALVGACLMVASGALPLEDAYKAIDFNTITLLLGMMIVVANLRLSGFFALANAWVARRAQRPLVLLIAITAVAGVFSAFLVNDAICLVLAPLVLEL